MWSLIAFFVFGFCFLHFLNDLKKVYKKFAWFESHTKFWNHDKCLRIKYILIQKELKTESIRIRLVQNNFNFMSFWVKVWVLWKTLICSSIKIAERIQKLFTKQKKEENKNNFGVVPCIFSSNFLFTLYSYCFWKLSFKNHYFVFSNKTIIKKVLTINSKSFLFWFSFWYKNLKKKISKSIWPATNH